MIENYFIDNKKIKKFKNIKKPAGKEIQILSFNFIRTIKPHNISRPRPKEDIIKNKSYFNPSNKPVAPKNSNIIVNKPSFSRFSRLNSFFI